MRYALVREISSRINECELTHRGRTPIDLDRAREQHAAYAALLKDLGCHVITLPADDDHPDCVFIEDAGVVLDELAIMTRPGAESRRGEIGAVEEALAPHRRIERIVHPGTLEGGDVIVIGRTIFVGKSSRTNEHGIDQLAKLVAQDGYAVEGVEMSGCLHLKTGASLVGPNRLLISRSLVDADAFGDVELIEVAQDEPDAANAMLVGDAVIHAEAFPKTLAILQVRGIDVRPVPYDELANAEAGVTCCSIVFDGPWKPRLVE